MRGPPGSTNSLPGAGRLSGDVATARPRLRPILPPRPSTSLTAAAAGTTPPPSRKPTPGATTDANEMFDRDAARRSATVGEIEKGRNEIVSALFHVCSHAVAGRLACLSVVRPALVIFSVTPLPV